MNIKDYQTADLALTTANKNYYHFADPLDYPMERHLALAKLYRCYEELMTPHQLEEFLKNIKSTIFDGMLKANTSLEVASIFSKMDRLLDDFQFRRANITHEALLWEIMAVTYIQEDEEANIVSEIKNKEKIKFWKEQIKTDTKLSVFFCENSIKAHLPFTNINAESMELLLKNTEMVNQQLKTMFPSTTQINP